MAQCHFVFLFLAIGTCQLVLSGKVTQDRNDQSDGSIFPGRTFLGEEEKSRLQNDHPAKQVRRYVGHEDEKPIENEGKLHNKNGVDQGKPLEKNIANEKRFFGKIIDKVKQHVQKKYWTKQRFIKTLKALGILDVKEIKLFTASTKLIRKLLKSKNHVIDDFKKTKPGQCAQDDALAQDMGEMDSPTPDDAEMNDSDDEVKVIENDDQAGKLDKMVREMEELADDRPGNDQADDLENILKDSIKDSSDREMTANDNSKVVLDVQKRYETVDLCHETYSTLYVLAFPDANLAYKIPSVHCPNKYCKSKALATNVGKCAKKKKEMLLYVINSKFQFIPKTVICGCACECLHFKYLA